MRRWLANRREKRRARQAAQAAQASANGVQRAADHRLDSLAAEEDFLADPAPGQPEQPHDAHHRQQSYQAPQQLPEPELADAQTPASQRHLPLFAALQRSVSQARPAAPATAPATAPAMAHSARHLPPPPPPPPLQRISPDSPAQADTAATDQRPPAASASPPYPMPAAVRTRDHKIAAAEAPAGPSPFQAPAAQHAQHAGGARGRGSRASSVAVGGGPGSVAGSLGPGASTALFGATGRSAGSPPCARPGHHGSHAHGTPPHFNQPSLPFQSPPFPFPPCRSPGGYERRPELEVDVAIVGGGLAGLASAVALRQVLPRLRVKVRRVGREGRGGGGEVRREGTGR
jgi:hypothetical protein